MKNLKKFLAVLVVVAMMASLMVTASAAVPSDVKGTEYEAAVTRLVALGIITGYPDGTFGVNDTITRAQFAAVLMRAKGLDSAASAAVAATKFSDVPSSYWASGYIKMATDLGIIKGYPNGTFGPEDEVTYEQAVTMVVRMLGYEPAAEDKGGYPTGYLAIAGQEDILDDAEGTIGTPATRGLVAIMVDNALEVPLMIQTGYGDTLEYVVSGDEDTDEQTLLSDYLDLDEYENAEVLEVDTENRTIKVDYEDEDGDAQKDTFEVYETLPMIGLEDAFVTIWVKDDVVYNIELDSSTFYDFISEINGSDDVTDMDNVDTNGDIEAQDVEEVTLENLDDEYDLKVSDSDDDETVADITIDFSDEYSKSETFAAADLLDAFAKVVVNDGEIVRIDAYKLDEGGIVTAVEDATVEYTTGDDEGKKVRDIDDAESLLVVVDGAVVEYSDLKTDMYLDFYTDSDDNYVLVASSKKIEGTLSKAKDDEISIDGEYTDLADPYYYSTDEGDEYDEGTFDSDDFEDLLKVDVVAYVDTHGDIKYVKGAGEDSTDSFYGFAISVDDFDDQIKVTRSVDGEEDDVTYDTDLDDDSDYDLDEIEALLEASGFDADDPADRATVFFEFTFDSDNVITSIDDPEVIETNANEFDEDGDYIDTDADNVYAEDDTLIFDIGASDITVLTWADVEDAGTITSPEVVKVYYNDPDPDYILIDGTAGSPDITFSDTDAYLGFVLESGREDSDYYAYKLAIEGDDVDFLVDEDETDDAEDAQVVVYKTTSTDGEVEIADSAYYWNLASLISSSNDYDSDEDDNWAAVTGEVYSDGVDGRYVDVVLAGSDGTMTNANYNTYTTYKVATNAVIYRVTDAKSDDIDDYEEASMSEIEDDKAAGSNDLLYGIVADGQIRILFIVEQ